MGRFFTISLAAFAATGSFLFGYDSGVMTDVIESKNFLAFFNTTQTSAIIGAINSTFSGGAAIGALQGGLTMDRFGRKFTIQMGAFICLIGAILQSAAQNLAMILVGRIFAGWAVGLMSMSVPVYQAEVAHPRSRGLIVGLAQQMIGVGFIISTWVGYGSLHAPDTSEFQWRFPLAFQAVPALLLAVGMFFMPESPRYLVEEGKYDEGLRILNKLHFDGTNADWIQREHNEIRATIEAEKAVTAPGWLIMFKVPQWRTRLLHGTLVQVFTQMTGVNVIGYYQTVMYNTLGITGNRNTLVAGIYNCVGPLTNLIFIVFLLDRVGRRKPMLFGTVAITIALICEAALNSQIKPGEVSRGYSIGGVFFIFCVTCFFSLSFGPTSWTYMAEVMPMQIRGRGTAFATAVGNWTVSTLWAQVSPIALGSIGWKFYFIFVAFNICVTFPTVFLFFKETKQKSLEEIDLLFGGRALGHLPADVESKVTSETEKAEETGISVTNVEHKA
ncbi:sugar porter family MFS transporter [Aspergillus homomorphus CBS 101889]|uniref:General substrate transporter n=1 Tax=Aspergillus homomorphus (strain CBS 101889) TaxID=1450537 RepID=A0A395IB07_ASPHC|nr:general substrate transporter [Aspergillus homomorphus CBS 101889]RAL15344.1 general substrate transporter [Aspergillus homomorphus CBS 101889]